MGDPYADIGYWSAHWLLPCNTKCYITVRRLLAKSFSPYHFALKEPGIGK
jgi:hypothetical protein